MKKKHYSPNHFTQPASPARDIDFFYLIARLVALLLLSLLIALVSKAADTAHEAGDYRLSIIISKLSHQQIS